MFTSLWQENASEDLKALEKKLSLLPPSVRKMASLVVQEALTGDLEQNTKARKELSINLTKSLLDPETYNVSGLGKNRLVQIIGMGADYHLIQDAPAAWILCRRVKEYTHENKEFRYALKVLFGVVLILDNLRNDPKEAYTKMQEYSRWIAHRPNVDQKVNNKSPMNVMPQKVMLDLRRAANEWQKIPTA